ncbi:MAG: NAD(P)/FAD-dependent oxidoreductase [bacterium]
MKEKYDIVVVGGGPAGSWTAKHAAEGGASVLLLEKDREIGMPVRCAEGVSEIALKSFVKVKDRWIAQTIKGARLFAPDGTAVEPNVGGYGFILHRKLFDADLAAMAAESGAEIMTKAYVYGLMIERGTVAGVKVRHLAKDYEIRSAIVVGADGIESRVGRLAGIDTRTPPEDMDTCVQMTLTGIDIDPEYIEIHFGRQVAPGGFLWIFPKGPKAANVGLGISGAFSKNKKAIVFLQEFIRKRFPTASVLTMVAGGVPTAPTLKTIVADGLMLVGDAAHQVNPLSGGGIGNALIAGRIAGKVAAEAVRTGDVSAERLSEYPRDWHKAEGKNNERAYRIKKVVTKLSDEDLNKIAEILVDIPPAKRTLFRIMETALFKHPKLILEAAKIFKY